MKKALAVLALTAIGCLSLLPVVASAQGAPAATAAEVRGPGGGPSIDNDLTVKKYVALACGLGIAIAAFGGALGQGRAAAAALEGIARNPGAAGPLFTPFILSLALIESLVIYSLVISFLLYGKL